MKKREKINNTQLLADTGLKIRHFHTVDRFGYRRPRNLTVAFKDGRSTIQIATAVVHPSDCFSRKEGTKRACEAFLAGHTITVPKSLDFDDEKTGTAHMTLVQMFG